jgi:hypothetical protein
MDRPSKPLQVCRHQVAGLVGNHHVHAEDATVNMYSAFSNAYFQHLNSCVAEEELRGIVRLVADQLEAFPVAPGADAERIWITASLCYRNGWRCCFAATRMPMCLKAARVRLLQAATTAASSLWRIQPFLLGAAKLKLVI